MTATPHSQQNHQEFAGCGDRLRRAREAAGLSLDDVASRLKMPARVVKSLEDEDWSRLGAPVFVRGQVRSYSRLLGLATTTMMDALPVAPVEPAKLVSRVHTPKLQWWAEQLGRRLVYIVLTLSLAIPAWVATQQHLSRDVGTVAALDTPVDQAELRKAAAQPAPPQTLVASMAPVAAAAPAPVAKSTDIVLRASDKTWLEVIAQDGSILEKGLLSEGDLRRYPAAQVQRIKVGNLPAVTLEDRNGPVQVSAKAHTNVARFTVSSDGSLVAAD
ncbi:MAG: DUF4115 domain-containing protein [Thermomonas sp.]|uniref:helix-turn-helix domain-containing protein n=1 Tax=Thermomonas sp. TaxID=1971895 RepID=UPI001EBF9B87|nr:helix-turn-helix domain-containing protein [Thermomonas sp.]MBV2209957.1 DUF4115 domain-containing protein [Thermomonas sp.]